MRKLVVLGLLGLAVCAAGGIAPAAQAYVRDCGSTRGYYVAANSVTTCPFALNVARAVASGSRNPYVYSRATGRSYRMYCSRRSYRTSVCRGGNNAYVRLSRY